MHHVTVTTTYEGVVYSIAVTTADQQQALEASHDVLQYFAEPQRRDLVANRLNPSLVKALRAWGEEHGHIEPEQQGPLPQSVIEAFIDHYGAGEQLRLHPREWALQQGYVVAPRGRVPHDILEHYRREYLGERE